MANEPTAEHAATTPPAPAPAPRKVMAFRPQKSFTGATAVDRMKKYLEDVPVIHRRLTDTVVKLEATLLSARMSATELEATVARVKTMVAQWEEEQSHAGSAAAGSPPAAPVPDEHPAGGPPASGGGG